MDYYTAEQLTAIILSLYLGAVKAVLGTAFLLALVSIAGYWKVFKKAGQPGWGSLVPFYSSYLLYKITWGCGWLFLAPIVLSVAGAFFVNGIASSLLVVAATVLVCLTSYKTGMVFGKSAWFGVGLILLNWLFVLILGFSDAQYQGVLPNSDTARRDKD